MAYLLIFWFFKNILVSGCIIYPASLHVLITCLGMSLSKNYFVNANQISLESVGPKTGIHIEKRN